MGLTHAIVGMLVVAPIALVFPEFTVVVAAGGFVGGWLPDVDLFGGQHRKSLHYPVYYWVAASVALMLGVVLGELVGVVLAAVFVGAGMHSVMDIYCAGLELRPWERTDQRGVYLHTRNRWVEAQYWIPFDGSIPDFMLAVVTGVGVVLVYGDGGVQGVTTLCVVGAGVYAYVRPWLPDAKEIVEGKIGYYPSFFP